MTKDLLQRSEEKAEKRASERVEGNLINDLLVLDDKLGDIFICIAHLWTA